MTLKWPTINPAKPGTDRSDSCLAPALLKYQIHHTDHVLNRRLFDLVMERDINNAPRRNFQQM
ncbi:hypothetical protein D3C84_954670 [compost metagenome]